MKTNKFLLLTILLIILLTSCNNTNIPDSDSSIISESESITKISLSDYGVLVNGNQVKRLVTESVYENNDIVYYESGRDFTYGEGDEDDAHSKESANEHTVIHITKPGTYEISGKLSKGQIAVDLGDYAKIDPDSVVNLVLNNTDITCEVAPAIIFYNVYEPFYDIKTIEASSKVYTYNAGANIIIADNTINNIKGSHVARIYKPDTVVLSEDGNSVEEAKKLHKYDGAIYSKSTMNIKALLAVCVDNGSGHK